MPAPGPWQVKQQTLDFGFANPSGPVALLDWRRVTLEVYGFTFTGNLSFQSIPTAMTGIPVSGQFRFSWQYCLHGGMVCQPLYAFSSTGGLITVVECLWLG
jgi:hypothetical protein